MNTINKTNSIKKQSKVMTSLLNIKLFWKNLIKSKKEKEFEKFDREEKEWMSNPDNYKTYIEDIEEEEKYLNKLKIEWDKQFTKDIKENQKAQSIFYEHLEDMKRTWNWQD